MKQTLLTLCLLLAFGTTKAQNDATLEETIDWINNFGISKAIYSDGITKASNKINVSQSKGAINFYIYREYESGKEKESYRKYLFNDNYVILLSPNKSLYQVEIIIDYDREDKKGFSKYDYNFNDKTQAEKVLKAFKHLFDLVHVKYREKNMFLIENKF